MRREAMSRFSRILLTTDKEAVAAPPPEAVALESDFVIILAVLLCALICVVGLIAAARCAWRRRSSSSSSRAGSSTNSQQYSQRPSSSANKGLRKKVLQSLPKFTYTAATPTSSNGTTTRNSVKLELAPLSTECSICLGEFVEGDEIRVLPQCGHGFHVACIDRWLGSHSSCPSCRQILVVGRCQKCGQFPAVSLSAAGAGTEADRPAVLP